MNTLTSRPPLKFTKEMMAGVVKDWQQCIPSLTIRNTYVLSRLVGPLLISVVLDTKTYKHDYEPKFGLHNLSISQERIFITLGEPLRTIRTHAPDHIAVPGHFKDKRYIQAAARMKEQARLPLEGPITVSQILAAYQNYTTKPGGGNATPELIEDPALIAAWAGRHDLAQKALQWGYEELLKMSEHIQKDPDFGGSPAAWRAKMEERIAHPEVLREIVKQEIVRHKLTHIPQEGLIPV